MPLDLDSLRKQLREHLGIEGDDLDSLPDADEPDKSGADTYLNRSFWELLDKIPFREKEASGTLVTVAGISTVDLPGSFEALQTLSIEDLNTKQHIPLDRITLDEYEQKYANVADAQGKPEKYFRRETKIQLHPTPDDVYTLYLYYLVELADLSVAVSIPRTWHEVILFGAVWRAFLGVSGDYTRAQQAKAHQISLINSMTPTETKEAVDSHRSGIEVLGLDGEL